MAPFILTVGDMPAWLFDLASHLITWTIEANDPFDEDDQESDNRPIQWNSRFFYFLVYLAVAIPHATLATTFLEPMIKLKDEAFHETTASFLQGFNAAMRATDTKRPEDPVGVREMLAARIKKSANYECLRREKGNTSESHAADAICAMFFHPGRFAQTNKPQVPQNWMGLREIMAILTSLVVDAAPSGYLTGDT